MNIAIGKIGKSILFDSNKWGAIGGDNEAPLLYEHLFHNNPDKTFYIVGRSDYSKCEQRVRNRLNKHGNVIDIWSNWETERKLARSKQHGPTDFVNKWVEENPGLIELGLFFAGPTSTGNVIGKARKVTEPTELAKMLDMTCIYASPIIEYLNISGIKWNLILNDPRFFPASIRDLFNLPQKVLSQYNETIKMKLWKTHDDLSIVEHRIPSEYAAMETIFLIDKKRGDIEPEVNGLDAFFDDEPKPEGKDIKFMVVCNEGRPSRYPDLKRYILDKVEDIEIYGKWDERTIGDDPRFKGPKKFNDLQSMLPRVKYTFCIPIKKGWVTAKFWEMAHYGIIPFLHPTYDEQDNLKCPDFLRVKSAQDLFEKIEHLEAHPEHYEILKDKLDKMIKDEFYNGSYLNNTIMNSLKEIA